MCTGMSVPSRTTATPSSPHSRLMSTSRSDASSTVGDWSKRRSRRSEEQRRVALEDWNADKETESNPEPELLCPQWIFCS
ncbi:hypothetical protein BD413DRAFT_532917 [Trametes elegans]|nr:hypothetical protein BD413DRAFT_532917 [Trametes elegans]